MKRIIGIKFSHYGKIYCFFCDDPEIVIGDHVVAETGQGLGFARVMNEMDHLPSDVLPEEVHDIVRRASQDDFADKAENEVLTRNAYSFCAARIRERGLEMKLVDVEVLFDRSKLIFYFTAPTRIDFRELVKDLVREYHTRIELRQIGVRHETQMLGALGSCGMVCCCRRFLRKFEPVTIKMAKEQNLFLNPTKISGSCGRLLCCLSYEQQNYDLFHKSCPKLGKRYLTSKGTMKVLRANMLCNSVAVLNEKNEEMEFTLDEWQAMEPHRPEVPKQDTSRVEASCRDGHADKNTQHASSGELMVVTADPNSLERGEFDGFPDMDTTFQQKNS